MTNTKSTGKQILIVEDDGIISARLKSLLLKLGYAVLGTAVSGEKTIQKVDTLHKINGTTPDLVLMDIHLAGEMNGIETAVQIQADYNIPVIYLTAYADEALLQQAKITAPYGYLIKPVKDRELHAAIEMALYRHQLETKLRESESSHRTLAKNLPGMVYRVHLREDNRMQFFNDMLQTMTGYTTEELINGQVCSIEPFIIPEDQAGVAKTVKNAVAEGQTFEVEYRFRHKNGELRHFFERSRPINGTDGRPLYIDGVIIDVTKRKQAEEQLRLQVTALKAAANGIVITNREGDILWVNPAFTRLTGYVAEEIIGRNPRILKSGKHDQAFYRDLWETILAGQVWPGQMINRRKDGSFYTEEMTITPVYDEGGQISHFIAIKQDVTERIRAEEALRQAHDELETRVIERTAALSEANESLNKEIVERVQAEESLRQSRQRYKLLLDSVTDYIYTVQVEADQPVATSHNPACVSITGYTSQEYEADPYLWYHMVYEEDREAVAKQAAGTLLGEDTSPLEHRLIHKDGSIRWVRNTIVFCRDEQGQLIGYDGLISDITERKRLEERLEAIYRLGQELTLLRDETAIIRRVLETATDILRFEVANCGLVDKAADTLQFKANPPEFTQPPLPLAGDETRGISLAVVRSGQAINVSDTDQDARYVPRPGWSGRSELCVPMKIGRRVIGVLNVESAKPNYFTPADRQLLQTLADQTAVALENARLHTETERRTQQLTVLHKLDQAIISSLHLDDVYHAFARHTAHLLPYDRMSVALLEEDKIRLAYVAVEGKTGLATGIALSRENSPISWVIARRQPLLRHNIAGDTRFAIDRQLVAEGIRSDMSIPLWNKGQIIGTWNIASHQVGAYSPDDMEFAQSMADQLAIAIENVRLYAQAQQEIAERRRAQDSLRRAYDEVEMRVLARTAELAQANNSLKVEIAERKQAEAQLQHIARHDTLTDLLNRASFTNCLEQAITQSRQRQDYLFAVLFLDLDRFKNINDSLGHLIGDQLLIAIARRLKACVRPGDVVARLGGDEFAILLDDMQEIDQARHIADRIQDELAVPVDLNGHTVFTTASIGITTSKQKYQRPEDLLRDADTAMYQAKERGRARHELFDIDQHTKIVTRLQLETELRQAIERREFQIYYQPIISLAGGRITGVEALLRWQRPQRGLISPEEFIPLAEETGLIVPIGEWVLRTACTQIAAWHAAGYDSLRLAVNVSARQFQQQDLPGLIKAVLPETGLAAHMFGLEITESVALKDNDLTLTALNQLRAMGIRISIDDFGLGSSLNNLKLLPLDVLKIDQSFVRGMMAGTTHSDGGDDAAIITAIITMAHSLGLKVIAEGVETEAQLAFLRSQQCDEIQGHLFSKPLPAETLARLLQEGTGL